jgi:hypothetical protein
MAREDAATKIPCPFVYSSGKGKRCQGHVVRVEAYKADLKWEFSADGVWSFAYGAPLSHYHLFCSEKNNHAGLKREDALKFRWEELPVELRARLAKGQPHAADAGGW